MNIGDMIGQIMQQQVQEMQKMRGGMRQQHSKPHFVQLAPMPHHGQFDMLEDEDEDPFAFIHEMEARRRRPHPPAFFAGPPMHMRPSLHSHHIGDINEEMHHPGFGEENSSPFHRSSQFEHGKHIHNDLHQHSPLYTFLAVLTVAFIGFMLWFTFIKEAGTSLGNMFNTSSNVSSRKNQEGETKDISLSSFRKKE